MDANGNAMVVWSQGSPFGEIYARRYSASAGSFEMVTNIENLQYTKGTAQVRMDYLGRALAVFLAASIEGNYHVYANFYK